MTSAEQKAMRLAVEYLDKCEDFLNDGMQAHTEDCIDQARKILRAALAEQPAPSVGDEERAKELVYQLREHIAPHIEEGIKFSDGWRYEPSVIKLVAEHFAAIRSESALASSKSTDAIHETECDQSKCPSPISGDNGTAQNCIEKGHCGCDEADSWAPKSMKTAEDWLKEPYELMKQYPTLGEWFESGFDDVDWVKRIQKDAIAAATAQSAETVQETNSVQLALTDKNILMIEANTYRHIKQMVLNTRHDEKYNRRFLEYLDRAIQSSIPQLSPSAAAMEDNVAFKQKISIHQREKIYNLSFNLNGIPFTVPFAGSPVILEPGVYNFAAHFKDGIPFYATVEPVDDDIMTTPSSPTDTIIKDAK